MNRKSVVVTGASHGIGKEIAKEFAKAGYNVCINYNKSEKEAIVLRDSIIKENPKNIEPSNVIIYKADVSDRKQVDKMIEDVLVNFGSIDVVVNNAGICEYKLFTDITNNDLQKMFDVTIKGTFNVTQSVLKKCMLKNKSGAVINISSIWGMVGSSCEVNYSTMKAGIIGMTKALAKELGPSNIRVNAVTPGIIDTNMNANLNPEEIEELKQEIPLNRIGKTTDVAKLVRFLSSDEACYITGQVISPNGGFVI